MRQFRKKKYRASSRPQWMTKDVMTAVRLKRRRWKNYTRTKTNQDFYEYKKAEKEVYQKSKNEI